MFLKLSNKASKNNKNALKHFAFTLSEILITLVLIGVITTLYNVGIKVFNPSQKGFDVKSKKTLENIDQTITLIIAQHSPSFNLTYIDDSKGSFSVEDSDATARFAAFFREYMNIMDFQIDDKKYSSYYSSAIKDYNGTSTGAILKDTYSNFMVAANGTIFGFKLYGNCNSTEDNANPPLVQGKKAVNNICGSVFYDLNAFKGPNKLGSDQYIIPFDALGTEIKK